MAEGDGSYCSSTHTPSDAGKSGTAQKAQFSVSRKRIISSNDGSEALQSQGSFVCTDEPDDHQPIDDHSDKDQRDQKPIQPMQEAFPMGNLGNLSVISLPVDLQKTLSGPKKELYVKDSEYEPLAKLDLVILQAQYMRDKIDGFFEKMNRPGNMPPLVDETTLQDIVPDQEFQLPMDSPMNHKSPRSSLYTAASLEGGGDGNTLLESLEGAPFSKADGVLKDTMDALMHIKETPSKLYISMEDLRDIIYSETLRCNLLLAVVIGLPNCGKSKVIHEILKKVVITPAVIDEDPQKHSMQCYVENGLSSYGVIIVGRKPFDNLIWMPKTRQSVYMFACTSAILHNSLLQNQQVELVDNKLKTGNKRFKGFKENSLNVHMHRVYNYVDSLVDQCNLNPEISRILPSGVTSVNIIDAGLNQGVYDFLTLTARYCRRQFGFIFLDLKRDIPALHEMPDVDSSIGEDKHMLQLGSRIFYLVRFAAVSYFSTNRTSSLFVAVHDGTLPESEIESHIDTLRKAVSEEIRQQNLPPDMVECILPMDPQNEDDLKRLKNLFEKFVKSRQSAMLDLKLSYVFLRSVLSNDVKYSQQLFISLREIQNLCREMRLDESEIDTFIHTYTEFGSILFMKDILPDIVILQPAVFVNYLQKLYYPRKHDGGHNGGESSNGIMSMSEAHKILGNQNAAKVVLPFLVKSGLGVKLDRSEISFPKQQQSTQSSTYLFIPSSRSDNVSIIAHDLSTLYISFSSKIAPPNMAGTFLQKLLKLGYLIPSNYRNQLSLKLKNGGHQLDVVFHPKFVSLKLQVSKSHPDVHIYKNILFQCNDALSDITVLFPDLVYDYGLKCLQQSSETRSDSENTCMMCDYCRTPSITARHKTVASTREDWYNAVKEVEQSKDKAVEKLSLEVLIGIAEKISTIGRVKDAEIMSALSLSDEEQKIIKSTYQGDRHIYILSMLLAWVTKIGKNNATKQKLYNTLFRASTQFIYVF